MTKSVSELEEEIYDYYYKSNSEGDARSNGLWKDVIDAKKMSNPEEALLDLYKRMVDGVTFYY